MANNMLIQILNNLTKEQRAKLLLKGLETPHFSMWRTGKRRPTYTQCVALAEVTGCDLKELLLEVAMEDVKRTEEKRQKQQSSERATNRK